MTCTMFRFDSLELYSELYGCLDWGLGPVYRESKMSDSILLKLLNELGKRDKMRDLPSILSFFRNEFNRLNNTRA